MKIDRHHIFDAARNRVAASENAAVRGAGSYCYDPFRIGHGVVCTQQRLAHVLGNGAGHHQHIGMARRGDKAQAEALEIIKRIAERVNFQFAAVAGAGIDMADR